MYIHTRTHAHTHTYTHANIHPPMRGEEYKADTFGRHIRQRPIRQYLLDEGRGGVGGQFPVEKERRSTSACSQPDKSGRRIRQTYKAAHPKSGGAHPPAASQTYQADI